MARLVAPQNPHIFPPQVRKTALDLTACWPTTLYCHEQYRFSPPEFMTPRFDPTRAIIYDLARGQLKDEEGASRVNLPVSLILRLCEQAGKEATQDFAQSLGSEIGRRVADRMGQSANAASVEAWTEHLGGQLALVGLGDMSVERWGRALVLRVSGAPQGTEELLPTVLTAALQRSLGRDSTALSFNQDEGLALLIVSKDTANRARNLVAQGQGLGQVVEALHQGAA